MTDPAILAALSEGICPLCDTKLDKNRVCAAGVEWDIKRGVELRHGMHYEGKDHIRNCGCSTCRPPLQLSPSMRDLILSDNKKPGFPQDIEVDFYADLESRLVGQEITITMKDGKVIKTYGPKHIK